MALDPIIQALKDERIRQGRSQRWVTRKIGGSTASVNDWERGLKIPRFDRLRAWAKALGKDLHLIPLDFDYNQVAFTPEPAIFDKWCEDIIVKFKNEHLDGDTHNRLRFSHQERENCRQVWGTTFVVYLDFDVDANLWQIRLQQPHEKGVALFNPSIKVGPN